MNERPATPAGWFPDPLGRYEFRWFNGTSWTGDVSIDGRRYLDPAPLTAPVGGHTVVAHGAASTGSRAMSVIALVGGLVAVLTSWMPFLVVVGATGAITALVVGVFAVRAIRDGRAIGRDAARAGLVLGAIGLCLVPVGVWLTGRTVDEFQRFAEPGAHSVEITECTTTSPRRVTFTGTIENLESGIRSYGVTVDVRVAGASQGSRRVVIDDVAPGAVATFEGSVVLDEAGEPTCAVFDVTGPFPFGLDPNG